MQGRQILAPGPGHSPRDRSLAVKLSPNAPDGFVVYSHVGDDWRACRDYVKQKLGIPAWQPGDEQQRTITQPTSTSGTSRSLPTLKARVAPKTISHGSQAQ